MTEDELLFQKFSLLSQANEQFLVVFKIVEQVEYLQLQERNKVLLNYVASELFLVPRYYTKIFQILSTELPRMLNIAVTFTENYEFNFNRHVLTSIMLGNVVVSRPDLSSYALNYFNANPSPFDEDKKSDQSKKKKITELVAVSDLELVHCCYNLVKSNPVFYRNQWHWSQFFQKFSQHTEVEVKWLFYNTLAIVVGMSESQLRKLIRKNIPDLKYEESCMFYEYGIPLKNSGSAPLIDSHPCVDLILPHKEKAINISGIYIPILDNEIHLSDKLVIVNSTKNNLHKICLGLSSNKAICLLGPVGSSKTTLVEYLAAKTGRQLGKNFVKIQLGDQTDSKMLLGTFRCTDVPGEFVWQPGVLTQAVVNGHWLLLEDIDFASMDIASLLTGLLENRSLTVPGYRDSVPIAPGFQLFVTQRLITTITGHHKKHSNSMMLLEKHVLQINVDPLTNKELKEIVGSQYGVLSSIADRMIEVFLLFSHTSESLTVQKSARLISTRDFFKWCSRAIIGFDVSSQASALKVLQDAIDIFCCSYSNSNEALNLAKEISTNLGIVNQKAEFFFKLYKPDMKLISTHLVAGRASLERENNSFAKTVKFSFTRPSAVLLERIMCCINLKEPVLLVGETGTGKTSAIQYLAHTVGQKLIVINMNQQSDSADLLGGFKPVDMKFILTPIRDEFENVFREFFKLEPNKKYLSNIALCYNTQRWSDLVKLMDKSCQAAINRLENELQKTESKPEKREKDLIFAKRWKNIGEKIEKLVVQLKYKTALAFAFIKGSLVRAVENGHWVLLDEINLANAETLECLSGLLETADGSLCLLERGDKKPVKRHPNFTLFACMNPSTDVGKKDLPAGLRNRFTEFYVDELTEKNDLLLLVSNYLEASSLKENDLNKIVDFYLKVRNETITILSDGLGHKPHFSLRSLCRALMIASKNPCGTFKRSLYEAFCLSFLTQLDSTSYIIVEKLISHYIIGDEKACKAVMKQPIPRPAHDSQSNFLQFEGYWVKAGNLESSAVDDYILTESVRKNLKDLVRVVSIGKFPVLLQGDTSVGKTSLIMYLAKSSGNKCVRINNHEHTDLQEYIGSYVSDETGKLVFREGLLVEAMRKGHWIILDELNLAPSDVLEALNRVLDDNRELFISETQETVKANENFMLFATQNPPGVYGGRKMLSRAFRNRFVELHFNEIPPNELEFILHQRCQMALSYSKKMINVMTDLQMRRRGSAAFSGKQGFITLRDLFRWGERYRLAENTKKLYDWDQHLADEGYLVLAGRVRRSQEKQEIIEVIQKHLKRQVVPQNLFTLTEKTSTVTKHILEKIEANKVQHPNIVWTYSMRQLAVLVGKALEFKEPVLLVGETGGGKTSICQVIADNNEQELVTVNCHMHTESSDFLGGLRPVRDHSGDENSAKLFEWVDGPLITALVKGHVFLADEISLADDSVLERLNSLLEPERTLLLAEKGIDFNSTNNSEQIVAHSNFYFIATMNPGGDFGKKELSPALRNRFTEIWCEPCTNRDDLIAIIEQNIKSGISVGNQEDGSSGIGAKIMDFIDWFRNTEIGKRFTMSIRDILTWVNFLNICFEKMDVAKAYIHGAFLTFLDSLGSGVTSMESLKRLDKFKNDCLEFLQNQMDLVTYADFLSPEINAKRIDGKFGIDPFFVEVIENFSEKVDFSFNAPTTLYNCLRILRGMQMEKAILLEGSPGVGKTSLVSALAMYSGHKLFRVNLSDQTDISDLFGADLPVEGKGGQFAWRDGPLLQALKDGSWVLLDELNLASQSVLEGLNACLDHRGEIFIPELGKTFHVQPGTKFFGCQNPLRQGGSRRGLPQSFLNRFIQVYIDALTAKDLLFILEKQFVNLPQTLLKKMIEFNTRVAEDLDKYNFGNKGGPWECNLRDLTRWCQATIYSRTEKQEYRPENVVQLVYSDRLRTVADKEWIRVTYKEIFGCEVRGADPIAYVSHNFVFLGDARLCRTKKGFKPNVFKQEENLLVLRSQLSTLRSLSYCVNLKWMSILVGSSGTGKSSVVRTLANLAGKTLKTLSVTSAMDTTDILGGFEQTDFTRHLDEIVKSTQEQLYVTLQHLLIKGNTDATTTLFTQWDSYLEISSTPTKTTMNEESKLFKHKLAKLVNIWDKLDQLSDSETKYKLDKLRRRSEKIKAVIKKDNLLIAGGKFEWVDSILIKCLQEGHWLLIDNVNLCSAAVLDRLNALLEPNGVLTISERGVDSNGRMIEIVPHEDFRLFLTMDPKNGEISRAMRNRGVEIYLLSEREGYKQNQYDIESLISLKGLKDPRLIKILLDIHEFVKDLILGDKPNVNEILQAAESISQQLNCGVEKFNAFFHSIIEIYYKTRNNLEFNCEHPVNVIKDEIKKYVDDIKRNCFYSKYMTMKTQNIECSSVIEKINQQACLLKTFLNDHERFYDFLAHFYSICSKEDLKIRNLFLEKLLESANRDSRVVRMFGNVYRKYGFEQNCYYPSDVRWGLDIPHFTDFRSNKVNFVLHWIADREKERVKIDQIRDSYLKEDKLALWDYAVGRKNNKMEDIFNNAVINQFLELIQFYDEYVIQILNHKEPSNEIVIEIIYLVLWRNNLSKFFSINVKDCSERVKLNISTTINVHYKWFFKALQSIAALTETPISDKVLKITNSLNNNLEQQFSDMYKIGKTYQKFNNKPPPFTKEDNLKNSQNLNEIINSYDFNDVRSNFITISEKFFNYKEFRKRLIELKSLDNITVDELKVIQESHQNILQDSQSNIKLELFLISNIFNQFLIKDIYNNILQLEEKHINFIERNILIPIRFCGQLIRYNRTKDVRLLHEVKQQFYLTSVSSVIKQFNVVLGGEETQNIIIINLFSPMIMFHLSNYLIDADISNGMKIAKFGNYRSLMKEHSFLKSLIWENTSQISEEQYDYLNFEVTNACQSFEIYIKQLADVCNLDNPDIEMIITSLQSVSNLGGSKNFFEDFTSRLQRCKLNIASLNIDVLGFNEAIKNLSEIYIDVAYMKLTLNSKLNIIDPLAKKTLKKEFFANAINIFNIKKENYEFLNNIYSNSDNTLHPYYPLIVKKIGEFEKKRTELEKFVAVRPKTISYETVLQVINHSFSSILTVEYVNKIVASLNQEILNLLGAIEDGENYVNCKKSKEVLNQHESTMISYGSMLHEWSVYRIAFPDVVEPLLSDLSEFLYGLNLKISLLRKLIVEYENFVHGVNQEILVNFVRFPILHQSQPNYDEHLDGYTNGISNFVNIIFHNEEASFVKSRENWRILKCGLQDAFNHCIADSKTTNILNKNLFYTFHNLLQRFLGIWNKQQQEIEAKQNESESLYKTKSKCENKPEAEEIEAELKQLFPNFHTRDFPEFQKDVDFTEDSKETEETILNYAGLTNDNIKFVMNFHKMLMENLTKTEWLNPQQNKKLNPDYIEPLMEKFKLFKQILEISGNGLDYNVDKDLIGTLNVVLSVIGKHGDSSDLIEGVTSPTRSLANKFYDFYKDPNVGEVKSSYHILENLKQHVQTQLLDKWPEQSTLTKIIQVIERIYSFEITSPISRFLTGLEILLSMCHEWEEVAHSGVSLSLHSQELIQQIIGWRTMELNMWKDLLNQTYERLNEPICKWWIHLLNVMHQVIVQKNFTVKELIENLQKFLANSNLAEFQNRLNLFYIMHCHVTYLERTKESEIFSNILWNLYSYFEQFVPIISNKIKDLRAPIEKKLKDYVKIVRWKDINYWTIKETIEKSHKTLHKFVREYQDVLKQPVSPYLVNITNTKDENVGIWDRPQRQNPKTYHYTLDPEAYVAKQNLVKKIQEISSETTHLNKMVSYFLKSRKLCKEAISHTAYPSLIQSLDGFIGDIIERNAHLQSLEVNTSLLKEKRKSQAKNILQQKHRALADLFKILSKIGLSYRTGVIDNLVKDHSKEFLLKPIDLNACFGHLNNGSKDEKIITIWDSCEMYYQRAILRADVLETALKNPSKDLGIQNIERCKGFTAHLINLAQTQKSELIQSTRQFYYLRFYLKVLNDYCEGKEFIHFTIVEKVREVLKNILIVMNQYKIIMNSCPIEHNVDDEFQLISPLTLNSNNKNLIQLKHDQQWNKTVDTINVISNSVLKLSSSLFKLTDTVPAMEFEFVKLVYIPISDKSQLEHDLHEIFLNIEQLRNLIGENSLSDSLKWLKNEILEVNVNFVEENREEANLSTYIKRVEKLNKQILIIIQNVFKKYKEKEQEDIEELQDNHLKTLLLDNLSKDLSVLDLNKILRYIHEIAGILLKIHPDHLVNFSAVMSNSLPLLEQIIQLYQYFITQQVSSYRVICKMSSVLTSIFIELASKGFCIPPEFSDEMDSEGISKPSDGLGLGEGQGERDVSDKIETEDQLDEAQPAGQEKKQEEEDDCKEEEKGIEMSEDFDSKLQDKEKKNNEDESSESESETEADEQMGDTDKNAEQLDQQIWGSDKEEDEDEENETSEEKGNKGERQGEDELGANEDAPSNNEDREDKKGSEEKEKSKKDINELEEPEFDDEQTDPYHGNQPELPEPEPMDLPDDLQLDDGQENDNENPEENPFDVDKMKEDIIDDKIDKEDDREEDNKEEKENEYSSEDEDIERNEKSEETTDENKLDESEQDSESKQQEEIEKMDEEKQQDFNAEDTGLDQTQTKEDNVEAMEVEESQAVDKTQANQMKNQKSEQSIEELCQEDNPDKDGVGQSQMEESKSGHSAQTNAPQDLKSSKRDREEDEMMRQQRPGESDSQRTLGNVNEQVKKKLKTIESNNETENGEKDETTDENVEMYQHIKEAKENMNQVLDAATKEQVEAQKKEIQQLEEDKNNEDGELSEKLPPEEEKTEDTDMKDVSSEKAEKVETTKEKKNSNKKQHPQGEILEEIQDVNIEGEIVATETVPRGTETTHHTQYSHLMQTTIQNLSIEEMNSLRCEVEKQLGSWSQTPSNVEAEEAWQKISSVTSTMAQDLAEQLRLVLEPTQASRLKGDFRTGRRINMRKVIPYIASQFRKDKIWLRRTKPSKREYQIVLAIDDSSSMADNHSKELAFESVALISKALTLLESGQLGVMSFGENIEILHKLSDQFTDRSGIQLLQKFKFDQNKTYIGALIDFATEMFGQTPLQSNTSNARLLVIVSDGRGVFSQGETFVQQAVRRAKLMNIFMVFVIIDNPENKSSILDIRMPVFKDGKLLGIRNYMDVFPFSFYIILRDINSLPSVLSDALRQWFEVVSNLDK